MSQIDTPAGATRAAQEAPLQPDQEWANALTHGIATVVAALAGAYLVWTAAEADGAIAIACLAYSLAVVGTFLCSTLSHLILRQPALDTLRAWDQGMIYAMISGTYTPIVAAYAPPRVLVPLMTAIWIAAGAGFATKIALRHRINSAGTISYLMLGWLPAVPLAGHVPSPLVWSMVLGGVVYSIGVAVLINDSKLRYLHALWHLTVMTAASIHYFGILRYVAEAG